MKILVHATSWLGDAVLSVPALEALRQRWPAAEVVTLARDSVASLYQGQPFVHRTIALGEAARGGWRANEQVAARLRAERFDVAVALPNSFISAWRLWRAHVPERIGYRRDGRGWLLTRAVKPPQRGEIPGHESYFYLELLRRAGLLERLPVVQAIRLTVPPEAQAAAEERLEAAGARRPRVAIAPGASYGPAKCWPAERFAVTADRLREQCDATVILLGNPAEAALGTAVTAAMRHRPVNLIGQTSPAELAAVLSLCQVFIGNDAGAMHVAAAVGVPVVAIFGSTDPEATGPVTDRRTLLRHRVSCSPCFLRYCPIDHRCMTGVSVDDVVAAARCWLDRS